VKTNQVKKYEVGNLCLSTEEMCGALETYNARASTTRTPVIFSKDVVAMYPNLQHEGVARTFRVEFLWSELTIEKVEEVLELGEKTTIKFLTMEQLPTREQEKLLLALGKVAGHAGLGQGVQGQDGGGHQHPPRHEAVHPPALRG
jgi:hypothetical protein